MEGDDESMNWSPASAEPGVVERPEFRHVLGHFVTGVTVITGTHRGQPFGLCANSFTSVSLDPPLVAFAAGNSSTSWPRIRSGRRFCVNVLAEDQEHLARRFAMSGGDKFAGVAWAESAHGLPLLEGALATIECTIEAEQTAGDHLLVLGRVLSLAVTPGARPLLFYRGDYARFAS
jgi:flavin reductase (DIM6/NTAB) family NADH-FMN oxidoreductase RutF